jgi:8-oxo-dGTP diphosphatase
MPLAELVALHEVAESEATRIAVPRFAVVIARGPRGPVLVFNLFRKVWELPGGLIDPGESPVEAAARELLEEAECSGHTFKWLGLVEVSDGATHFGAVFSCEVDDVPAAVQNEEIDGIAYWRREASPQPLGATDAALLNRLG